MQLTAKLAVLATAVASIAPTVLALAVDTNSLNSLTARDLIEEFYEARGLDTRSFNEELEVREFLEFLDARGAPPATTASPTPSATPAASTAAAGASPSASAGPHDGHHDHHHTHAHIPAVLIHALTAEHHPKLKHYAQVELHIFNLLKDLSDGEPQHNGFKESPEVEKLAKDILHLAKWHHHAHKHAGDHHAPEKHDGAKDSAAPSPSPSTSAAGAAGTAAGHDGHHGHHGLHAKIQELKLGSPKADRYIARAKVHKDRLALLALGPIGEHDEAYEAALKHEKEWLERHQKLDAKHHQAHHDGAATSTGASLSPSAAPSGAPKADKPADPKDAKTPQGVKRRALRRRYF